MCFHQRSLESGCDLNYEAVSSLADVEHTGGHNVNHDSQAAQVHAASVDVEDTGALVGQQQQGRQTQQCFRVQSGKQ